ncbi:MAG: Fur family transcriptional regulator [Phycisphaerales bacterium]|nr:Fur family transcriptional regulator [Phycisphaerales bacterium]
MTDAPAPEIVEPLCAVFRRALKAQGQKYTPERAQILDIVTRFDGLFEADQVLDRLKAAGFRVSKATVYRTIRLLQDAGIIHRIATGDGQSSYQLAYGSTPLDLLIDLDEGRAIPIDTPELIALRDRIARAHGLVARGHRLQIFASRSTAPHG